MSELQYELFVMWGYVRTYAIILQVFELSPIINTSTVARCNCDAESDHNNSFPKTQLFWNNLKFTFKSLTEGVQNWKCWAKHVWFILHSSAVWTLVSNLTFQAIILFVQSEQYIHNTQESNGATKARVGGVPVYRARKAKFKNTDFVVTTISRF